MFNSYKASAAQQEYCQQKNLPRFAPNEYVQFKCHRCNQNIYAETGHPVAERLPRGKVRLDYSKDVPGIDVEKAGRELICGCPFCHASFDD